MVWMHWVQQAQRLFRVPLLPSGTWQPGASLLDTPPFELRAPGRKCPVLWGGGPGNWGTKIVGQCSWGRRAHRPVGESRHSGRAVGVTAGEQREPGLGLDPTGQPAGLSVLGPVRPRVQG